MSSESKSTAEESAAVLFNSIVGGRNERGIPAANFVVRASPPMQPRAPRHGIACRQPSVDAFLAETGATVEAVLKILQELHRCAPWLTAAREAACLSPLRTQQVQVHGGAHGEEQGLPEGEDSRD